MLLILTFGALLTPALSGAVFPRRSLAYLVMLCCSVLSSLCLPDSLYFLSLLQFRAPFRLLSAALLVSGFLDFLSSLGSGALVTQTILAPLATPRVLVMLENPGMRETRRSTNSAAPRVLRRSEKRLHSTALASRENCESSTVVGNSTISECSRTVLVSQSAKS